jgi:hypothetical protein
LVDPGLVHGAEKPQKSRGSSSWEIQKFANFVSHKLIHQIQGTAELKVLKTMTFKVHFGTFYLINANAALKNNPNGKKLSAIDIEKIMSKKKMSKNGTKN